MTALGNVSAADPPSGTIVAPRLGAAGISIGLGGIVGARMVLMAGWVDGLLVGATFGLALAALWVIAASPDLASGAHGRSLLAADAPRRLAIAALAGLAFGLALVFIALAGAAIRGSPVVPGLGRQAAELMPWAAITVVVAAAEEGILRGVLFDRIRTARGPIVAVAITTIAFALIHVPAYGWHVVPLDLAVGLGLAGLRLSTRTVLAPAVAHVVADLATWWL